MRTPAELRARLARPMMSGDEVVDTVDELLDSGYWLLGDFQVTPTELRIVVRSVLTGEEFNLTARQVAA